MDPIKMYEGMDIETLKDENGDTKVLTPSDHFGLYIEIES